MIQVIRINIQNILVHIYNVLVSNGLNDNVISTNMSQTG